VSTPTTFHASLARRPGWHFSRVGAHSARAIFACIHRTDYFPDRYLADAPGHQVGLSTASPARLYCFWPRGFLRTDSHFICWPRLRGFGYDRLDRRRVLVVTQILAIDSVARAGRTHSHPPHQYYEGDLAERVPGIDQRIRPCLPVKLFWCRWSMTNKIWAMPLRSIRRWSILPGWWGRHWPER